jgi:hypothetical protein
MIPNWIKQMIRQDSKIHIDIMPSARGDHFILLKHFQGNQDNAKTITVIEKGAINDLKSTGGDFARIASGIVGRENVKFRLFKESENEKE